MKTPIHPRSRRQGQALVEYALILAFISVVAVSVLASLGGQIKDMYTRISSALAAALANP